MQWSNTVDPYPSLFIGWIDVIPIRIPGIHGCVADYCQCSVIGFLICLHCDSQDDRDPNVSRQI